VELHYVLKQAKYANITIYVISELETQLLLTNRATHVCNM